MMLEVFVWLVLAGFFALFVAIGWQTVAHWHARRMRRRRHVQRLLADAYRHELNPQTRTAHLAALERIAARQQETVR